MKLPILLTLCLLAGGVNPARPQARRTRTQTEQTRSADRERAKREQAVADSLAHLKALRSLDRLDFALEADRLTLRRGRVVFVSSDTNFVTLSGDMATVQVAPFMGGGPNGIGGITLEGHASNIRVRTDKRGNTTFSMNVFGRGISATLSIRLPAGSNRASANPLLPPTEDPMRHLYSACPLLDTARWAFSSRWTRLRNMPAKLTRRVSSTPRLPWNVL